MLAKPEIRRNKLDGPGTDALTLMLFTAQLALVEPPPVPEKVTAVKPVKDAGSKKLPKKPSSGRLKEMETVPPPPN